MGAVHAANKIAEIIKVNIIPSPHQNIKLYHLKLNKYINLYLSGIQTK
jgi:hypothetical protein